MDVLAWEQALNKVAPLSPYHAVSLEASSSSWLRADMEGGERQFHVLFLEVISEALIISLEGRKRKILQPLLLCYPFPIRNTLERKQTGTKRQRGPTQRIKSVDLITIPCLSLTERVYSLSQRAVSCGENDKQPASC